MALELDLPADGEDPWGDKLRTALVGLAGHVDSLMEVDDSRVYTLAATYGVGADGNTPEENRAALQTAVDEAAAQGRPVYLPALGFSVSGAINLDQAGTQVRGIPGRTKITTLGKPEPAFKVTAADCVVADLAIIGEGLDMTEIPYEHYGWYAGVHLALGSDRSQVRNLTVKDMYIGVRIDIRDYFSDARNTAAPNTSGLVVDGLRCTGGWVAVDIGSANGFYVNDIEGTYDFATATDGTDVGQNPHLIYLHRSGAAWSRNQGGTITNCRAINPPAKSGAAYALKYTDGLTASNLSADGSPGVLDIIGLADSRVENVVSVNDRYGLDGVSISTEFDRGSIAVLDADRVYVEGSVSFAAGPHTTGAIAEATARNCTLDVTVVARHSALTRSTLADVVVKGVGNEVRASVRNLGTVVWPTAIQLNTTGKGGVVHRPRVGPGYTAAIAGGGMHGQRVDYIPADLQSSRKFTDPSEAAYSRVRLDGVWDLEDSFDRVNVAALSVCGEGRDNAAWSLYSSAGGQVGVSNGQAKVSVATAYAVVDVGFPQIKHTVQATFHGSVASPGAFLVGRFVDLNNFIYASNGGTNHVGVWGLVKRVAGVITVVQAADVSFAPTEGDIVSLTFDTTSVSMHINGARAAFASISDSVFAPATKVGLGGAASAANGWTDFKVRRSVTSSLLSGLINLEGRVEALEEGVIVNPMSSGSDLS